MIWIAVGIVLGQAIIAVVLWKVMKTFGIYAESLLYTHQQNVDIRLRLAQQENDRAAIEALRRTTSNEETA